MLPCPCQEQPPPPRTPPTSLFHRFRPFPSGLNFLDFQALPLASLLAGCCAVLLLAVQGPSTTLLYCDLQRLLACAWGERTTTSSGVVDHRPPTNPTAAKNSCPWWLSLSAFSHNQHSCIPPSTPPPSPLPEIAGDLEVQRLLSSSPVSLLPALVSKVPSVLEKIRLPSRKSALR